MASPLQPLANLPGLYGLNSGMAKQGSEEASMWQGMLPSWVLQQQAACWQAVRGCRCSAGHWECCMLNPTVVGAQAHCSRRLCAGREQLLKGMIWTHNSEKALMAAPAVSWYSGCSWITLQRRAAEHWFPAAAKA